ncbi:MAG: hypothetical protein NTY18_03290, partial [Deltaproteobacteria bacterium]|nr:hypothetical protein [Deltaproteobacteria bacterium]
MRRTASTAGLFLVLLASGCRSGSPGGESAGPAPVAVVNGEPVSRAAFERELQQLRVGGGEGSGPTDVLKSSV